MKLAPIFTFLDRISLSWTAIWIIFFIVVIWGLFGMLGVEAATPTAIHGFNEIASLTKWSNHEE